jgi:hypothetical protein
MLTVTILTASLDSRVISNPAPEVGDPGIDRWVESAAPICSPGGGASKDVTATGHAHQRATRVTLNIDAQHIFVMHKK